MRRSILLVMVALLMVVAAAGVALHLGGRALPAPDPHGPRWVETLSPTAAPRKFGRVPSDERHPPDQDDAWQPPLETARPRSYPTNRLEWIRSSPEP